VIQPYIPAQSPTDEDVRVQALRALETLDTAPDAELDALVEAASQVCAMPLSLISLIDSDRQWFKGKTGLDATQTPRDISFCGHAILQDDIFKMLHVLIYPHFAGNSFVANAHCLVDALSNTNSDTRALH
jgi:hypothetical protein